MLVRRTAEEHRAYIQGFNAALELAARRMEEANEETARQCIIEALHQMKQSATNTE